ncbi:MAG: hypothetical protein PWQ57_680 [Desulfovibrionales bacterium]|jgi:hypothetical protein|nr:hypothetical protein [Desulfovibrionales bacterium]
MKYIMFEDFSGDPIPIIFPHRIDHGEMREQVPYSKVLSAGYVQVREGKFYCHGEAKSLNARARSEDAKILDEKFSKPEA